MTDTKTYTGGCHCGKVRYEVKTNLEKVMSCNCSICSKTGSLLTFVPAEQFTLLSGESDLNDYQFHRKNVHHLFCSSCGVRSFVWGRGPDGTEMRGVNVRCLEGVDISALTVTPVDGKSF